MTQCILWPRCQTKTELPQLLVPPVSYPVTHSQRIRGTLDLRTLYWEWRVHAPLGVCFHCIPQTGVHLLQSLRSNDHVSAISNARFVLKTYFASLAMWRIRSRSCTVSAQAVAELKAPFTRPSCFPRHSIRLQCKVTEAAGVEIHCLAYISSYDSLLVVPLPNIEMERSGVERN
jgi:hypothetical protein